MGIGVLRAGALFALASAGALLASPMGSNAPDWCSLAGQFDTWSEWRGPGKTTCSLILAQVQRRGECAGSISARHSFRTFERKVCGQELRLVLFVSSHESSGPKLLAVQLPHGCLRTLQHTSRRPQNGESGDVASSERGLPARPAAEGLDGRAEETSLNPAAPMPPPSADLTMHSTRAQDAAEPRIADFRRSPSGRTNAANYQR